MNAITPAFARAITPADDYDRSQVSIAEQHRRAMAWNAIQDWINDLQRQPLALRRLEHQRPHRVVGQHQVGHAAAVQSSPQIILLLRVVLAKLDRPVIGRNCGRELLRRMADLVRREVCGEVEILVFFANG